MEISGVMTIFAVRPQLAQHLFVDFLSDGTATSSQSMHDATLKTVAYGFRKVMTCAEFRDRIQW